MALSEKEKQQRLVDAYIDAYDFSEDGKLNPSRERAKITRTRAEVYAFLEWMETLGWKLPELYYDDEEY